MEKWYRCHLSDFHQWAEREHAEKYLIFSENIGSHLSYDELYTIVTNKAAKGRKGAIVAIIKGTSAAKRHLRTHKG